MEPFEVLAGEAAGHPVVPLPAELARIYGGDLRFAEECVYANFVATRNGNYGTNGATWLRPGAILPARLLKFGGQFNF